MALRVSEEAYRTDTGRQRTANEDSYYAEAPVFAVADGMGGAQAGEVASRIAAESFAPAVRGSEAPEAFLRSIATAANDRIHSLAQHDSTRSGMGTTLTAAIVEGDEVSFAHVGDSRAYLWRDGHLRLLTSDHSLVEELRRQGRISDAEAEDHPQRSIITRALGPEASVDVDTLSFSARPGDVFLLCSDGLTTMVKDDGIAAVLTASESLSDAVSELVAAANEAGGRDNITVVAFELEEAEVPEGIDDGATLIGPSAEEAGLTSERVRAASASRSRAPSAERRAPSERHPWRTAAKVLISLLLVGAIVAGAIIGARQVYFLGIDEGGRVTMYRGLPYDLPLGIELYSEVESIPVQARSIPEDRRDSLTNHELRSRDDALSLLDDLETAAVTPTTNDTTGGGQADGGANSSGNGGDNQSGTGQQPSNEQRATSNGRKPNGGNTGGSGSSN